MDGSRFIYEIDRQCWLGFIDFQFGTHYSKSRWTRIFGQNPYRSYPSFETTEKCHASKGTLFGFRAVSSLPKHQLLLLSKARQIQECVFDFRFKKCCFRSFRTKWRPRQFVSVLLISYFIPCRNVLSWIRSPECSSPNRANKWHRSSTRTCTPWRNRLILANRGCKY